MTNRLRGYTRQKRLGNTALEYNNLGKKHANPYVNHQPKNCPFISIKTYGMVGDLPGKCKCIISQRFCRMSGQK